MEIKSDFCRFCFKNLPNLIEISLDLYDQIENCFCIQISNKYFAKNLCENCLEAINASFNLKNKLKDSEQKLISILNEDKKSSSHLIDKVKPDFENIKVEVDVNAYNETDYSGTETNELLKSSTEDVNVNKDVKYNPESTAIDEGSLPSFKSNEPLKPKEKKLNKYFENGFVKYVRYACKICKRNFKGERFVVNHIKLEHDGSKNVYRCKVCGCYLKLLKNLKIHLKSYHSLDETGNDDDVTDGEKYYDIVEKYENMKIHCIECGAQFTKRKNFLQHWIRHDKSKKCEFCEKMFHEKILNLHMANVHNQHRFCGLCNKDVKQYDYHFEKVHTQRDDLKECKICQKQFLNLSLLNAHIKRVHNLTFCHICGKNMKLSALKRHVDAFHIEEKNYNCEKCPKSFSTLELLKKHRKRVHDAEYIFNCDKCEKKFKTNSQLNRHKQKSHENYRPHKCQHCSKAFFEKKSLDEHINTHTGVRPFVCKVCGDAFGFKSSLYTHNKLKHLKKLQKQTT